MAFGLCVQQLAFPVHNVYHGGVVPEKKIAKYVGWFLVGDIKVSPAFSFASASLILLYLLFWIRAPKRMLDSIFKG